MKLFSIDADNTITTFATADQLPEGQEHFATEKELAGVAANWAADRLVAVWNSFAGVAGFGADLKPVKKFTDRKAAVARIFKAIQKLAGEDTAAAPAEAAPKEPKPAKAPKAPKAAKPAKAAKVAKPAKAPKAAPAKKAAKVKTPKPAKAAKPAREPRDGSKKAIVIDMMRAKGGATMAEIMKATGWQTHSVRGFVAGMLTKKMGMTIESTKNAAGERQYRIAK